MAADEVSIEVPAPPDAVWSVVGDFGHIDAFFPGIDSVKTVGDDRLLQVGQLTLRERLVSKDDESRALRYRIVEGYPGLEHHEAWVTVTPSGSGSVVSWSFDVRPDKIAPGMSASYTRALGALRDHFS